MEIPICNTNSVEPRGDPDQMRIKLNHGGYVEYYFSKSNDKWRIQIWKKKKIGCKKSYVSALLFSSLPPPPPTPPPPPPPLLIYFSLSSHLLSPLLSFYLSFSRGTKWTTMVASVAQLDAPSDWRPGGRRFNLRRGRQHSFVEIDHEIFSVVILSLPLIQEGQLSVSGERMWTILVNHLED